MDNTDPRDHGHEPSPDPVPGTVPRVVRVNPEGHVPCKLCGCLTTCEIEVELLVPEFDTGKGWGRYNGCPACAFASAMDVFEEKPG